MDKANLSHHVNFTESTSHGSHQTPFGVQPVLNTLRSPVVLLGARSLIGPFLIRRLTDAQIAVVALSRRPAEETMGGVRWLTRGLTSADLGVAPGNPLAISLLPIGQLPPMLPNLGDAGIRRLIAFSSTSIFTKRNSSMQAERDRALALEKAESGVRALCDERGIGWTILRPTMVYAEGKDKNVTRLAMYMKRFGVMPLAGVGSGKRQPVHADDLAAGALAAALSPHTSNRAYNVPGGETLSYRALCERIFEGIDRKPLIISVPPLLWNLAFRLAGPFMSGFNVEIGARMSQDLSFDSTPAKVDFAWQPRAFHPRFRSSGQQLQ